MTDDRRVRPYISIALLAILSGVAARVPAAEFADVSLNVPDPVAAAQWYAKNLGGSGSGAGPVAFGGITISFTKADGQVAGSVGSVIDHLGFSYPDIEAKMRELDAAGVTIVSGVEQEGPIKYAFVRDNWGTLIEIVQDPEISGFHHIHLATADPKAALRWYQDVLGGEVSRFAGLIPGIRYGNAWLLAKQVTEPRAATKGRSIDHVSWSVPDVDGLLAKVKASGIAVEPTATFTAPGGVHMALVARK